MKTISMHDQTVEEIQAETALREKRNARSDFIIRIAVKPFIWTMTFLGLSVWLFDFWLSPYEGDTFILSGLSIAGAFMAPVGVCLIFGEISLFFWRYWK